jgi:hypothetical protein
MSPGVIGWPLARADPTAVTATNEIAPVAG